MRAERLEQVVKDQTADVLRRELAQQARTCQRDLDLLDRVVAEKLGGEPHRPAVSGPTG